MSEAQSSMHDFSQLDESIEDTSEQHFPVHNSLDVVRGKTVWKKSGWWRAVLTVNVYDDINHVMVYLWQEEDGDWKRRQKYVVKSEGAWETERSMIDEQFETLEDDTNTSS